MSVFNQSLHHLSLHLVLYPCFPGLSEFYLYGASLIAMKSKSLRMFHLHLLNKVMTHFLWIFANYIDSGSDLTCSSLSLLCSPFLGNILSFIITYSFLGLGEESYLWYKLPGCLPKRWDVSNSKDACCCWRRRSRGCGKAGTWCCRCGHWGSCGILPCWIR